MQYEAQQRFASHAETISLVLPHSLPPSLTYSPLTVLLAASPSHNLCLSLCFFCSIQIKGDLLSWETDPYITKATKNVYEQKNTYMLFNHCLCRDEGVHRWSTLLMVVVVHWTPFSCCRVCCYSPSRYARFLLLATSSNCFRVIVICVLLCVSNVSVLLAGG